tara:strand:+ start:306 stop:488 length:183 start_codon:yes stop_codon:yes gene_type:complete
VVAVAVEMIVTQVTLRVLAVLEEVVMAHETAMVHLALQILAVAVAVLAQVEQVALLVLVS